MADDPYDILGVKRTATQKEIQTAYRKLAKKLHPDLNPGNTASEEKFKAAASAYAILSDEDKRKRFDSGEIDASGADAPPKHYYRDYAGTAGQKDRYANAGAYADFGDGDDIFSSFFSRRAGAGGTARARGQDRHFSMEVEFLDAFNGIRRDISLPDGPPLDIRIPPGTRDGQTLRLRGKGDAGFNGGEAGDALIEIRVRPHPLFRLDGDDIGFELPISISEAVLGGKIDVPTPSGPLHVTLPAHSNSGKVLRLKGKGAPKRDGAHGDLFLTLKILLPEKADAALSDFVRDWQAGKAQAPRRTMGV